MVLPLALVTIYLATLIRCHGVITRVQGLKGSPLGVGFQGTADSRRKSPSKHSFHTVNPNISRECIDINPCQQDTAIIRDAEIKANAANQCGRTELGGNIDVGENTENAIKEKQVTQVKSGSNVTVTVHQVNADGAGPYTCDLDETSNTGKITHNLTVTNNVPGINGLSLAKTQSFNITVTMPKKLNCTGGESLSYLTCESAANRM
ncbi:hypothetical protein Purlil1_10225 [Purpureocillium lilacinum]|uniref:Secreted protein n=1 Tax=Purpureocillium lilacinum TaxID=33203 RepID=A0ABR0BNU6_PURLI|nr:hypothetical protein Purlil1_10225 [Purpureocillium lilacinum]